MPTSTTDGLTAVALDRWPGLVGLSALLTGSGGPAQDAYVTALRRRVDLRDPAAGLAYLRRLVVERSRRTRGANPPLDLDVLPRRQREALVLRLFSGASDAQTAAATRCALSEITLLVAKALASLDVAAEVVTARMGAYAATLDTDRPDPDATAVVATRGRRRGTALVVTAAVVVLALLGAGLYTAVQPRGHGAALEGPLPGSSPTATIAIPADVSVIDAGTAGGEVWALAVDDSSDNRSQLLRGRVGATLVRFAGTDSVPPGAQGQLLVAGGRALVIGSVDDTGTDHTEITTYDAGSGAVLDRNPLPAGESAAFVPVIGGGTAQVIVTPDSDGGGTLTVSSPGTGQTRGPVYIPAAALSSGVVSAAEVTAIVVAGGVPGTAYLQGPPGSLPRVDLRTGVLTHVRLNNDMGTAGESSGVVGEVGGRVLYESSDGLFASAPNAATAARVGDGDNQQVVLVADGRAYTSVEPTGDTQQELDPTTLAPVGPISTTRAGQGPVLELPSGGAAVAFGVDGRGYGGRLMLYAP